MYRIKLKTINNELGFVEIEILIMLKPFIPRKKEKKKLEHFCFQFYYSFFFFFYKNVINNLIYTD